MRPNFQNLIIAGLLLILVTACFYRSNREVAAGPESLPIDAPVDPPAEVPATDASAPSPAVKEDQGDFIVEPQNPGAARYQQLNNKVRAAKLLEKAADQLNRALILPYDIRLRAKECGEQNAFYEPKDKSITICYELMDRFYETFRRSGASNEAAYEKMLGATQFVFLHEVGHSLIDAYNLPVTGNEEEAADRLSAFVNLNELGEDGVDAVFAAADAFAIESRQTRPAPKNLADEHLLQGQRFYNSLCMIYGSNPRKYTGMVSDGYLPSERATRCKNEYQRTVESWVNLLEPWRKS